MKIQSDDKGKDSDLKEVLIIRRGIEWEIGLSVKYNHFALKYIRSSKNLDFWKKWYGIDFSEQYWTDIKSIFEYLYSENKRVLCGVNYLTNRMMYMFLYQMHLKRN